MFALPIFTARGSEPTAASGGRKEANEWQWPRCPALTVADEAGHKRVQGSVAYAAGLSARKIPGTPNGSSDLIALQRSVGNAGARTKAHRAPQQETGGHVLLFL